MILEYNCSHRFLQTIMNCKEKVGLPSSRDFSRNNSCQTEIVSAISLAWRIWGLGGYCNSNRTTMCLRALAGILRGLINQVVVEPFMDKTIGIRMQRAIDTGENINLNNKHIIICGKREEK